MSVAPDYAEPIVGWRAWLVVVRGGGVAAASVVYDALWLPRRELVAGLFPAAEPIRPTAHTNTVAAKTQ